MLKNKCAFLVSSCDEYSDLWNPFFECLDKIGGGCPLNVYLNTEWKKYIPDTPFSFHVNVINQNNTKTISWSARMIEVLQKLTEEYVFLILDDYFVQHRIEWDYVDKIINLMEENCSVASVQLRGSIENKYIVGGPLKLCEIGKNGWRVNFVPTIWRKSVLLKWLRPWESIWGFEGYGSARARRWNYTEKIMIVEEPAIYSYLWVNNCSPVINGKWLAEDEIKRFFEQNDICIDWAARGIMSYEEYHAVTLLDIVRRYKWWQVILKSINRVRSYF